MGFGQVLRTHSGYQPLKRAGERPLGDLSTQFREARAPVSGRQRAESGIRERLPELPNIDVAQSVAVSRERQNGIRARPHLAGDLLGEWAPRNGNVGSVTG